jgi:hypothetical protein
VRHRRRCPGRCSWLGCGSGDGVVRATARVSAEERPWQVSPSQGAAGAPRGWCLVAEATVPGAAAATRSRTWSRRAGSPGRAWSLLPASSVACRAKRLASIRDGSGSQVNRCDTRDYRNRTVDIPCSADPTVSALAGYVAISTARESQRTSSYRDWATDQNGILA